MGSKWAGFNQTTHRAGLGVVLVATGPRQSFRPIYLKECWSVTKVDSFKGEPCHSELSSA